MDRQEGLAETMALSARLLAQKKGRAYARPSPTGRLAMQMSNSIVTPLHR